ncbi:LamG domain-containing protein, partial [uncultured Arcobacter sp.]|uniref:LamG domain-containing protein n=1 Tax=uncultured Arcobacter sp. TaxID=165434 RepID=UPI0026136B9F
GLTYNEALDTFIEPLAGNLVHYWKMEDLTDSVGSLDLTNNGATSGATGIIGDCYSFDGSNDYIDITSSTLGIANNWTASLWVNWDSLGATDYMLDSYSFAVGGNNSRFFLSKLNTNYFRVDLYNSSGTLFKSYTATDNQMSSTGTWYHCMATWDGTDLNLYVNGNLCALTKSTDNAGTMADASREFTIGSLTGGSANLCPADIDEVGLWDRALTLQEASDLYSQGRATTYDETNLEFVDGTTEESLGINCVSYWKMEDATDSVSDNDGTVTGATSGVTGKIDNAYSFDGSNDDISANGLVTDVAGTKQGTMAAWIYIDDYAAIRQIMSFGDTNANERIQLYLETTGVLTAVVQDGGTLQWAVDTDSALPTGEWLHVALVMDGTEAVLYINGAKPAQAFFVTTDKLAWLDQCTGIDNFYIGARNYNNFGVISPFKGDIDEAVYFAIPLSIGEVQYLYNSGSPGAAQQWPFSGAAPPTGWTGTILGVTNPSKINGIAVANIAKVNGQ